jgi:hypothetical protein
VAHRLVAEAAVVSKPHEIKGESVFAYVVLNVQRPQGAAANALIEELRGWVGEQLSPIAKPDEIRLTDNLPKTRSGKIMRRLLRSIARGEEITQDMSTLENPAILEQLRGAAPGTPAATRTARPKRKAAAKKASARTRARPARKTKVAAKVTKRKVAATTPRRPAVKAKRSKPRAKK